MNGHAREEFVLRHIRATYGAFIDAAAAVHRHRPEVLAAIMCRESEGGLSPLLDQQGPAGRGDGGHGHGLTQIDDRSFPEFCHGPDWADPAKNIDMGAFILRRKRIYLAGRSVGYRLTDADLERATIAAYNAGEGRVLRCIIEGRHVDSVTAHLNYSREVLRIAEAVLRLQILDGGPGGP